MKLHNIRDRCGTTGYGRIERLNVTGFIWLDEIVQKLASKHRVEPYEVEELFSSRPQFRFVENGHRPGEDVYAALGQTEAGRHLITFFISKGDGDVLPLSARDMTQAERRRYGRK
jgi:uncharacterized DUF497 family protein